MYLTCNGAKNKEVDNVATVKDVVNVYTKMIYWKSFIREVKISSKILRQIKHNLYINLFDEMINCMLALDGDFNVQHVYPFSRFSHRQNFAGDYILPLSVYLLVTRP